MAAFPPDPQAPDESAGASAATRAQEPARPAAVAVVASIAAASATDFQRDLSRYWRHVRKKGEIGLTTRGWIYKSAFKHILQALNAPEGAPDDEERQPCLWFIRLLLTSLAELSISQARLSASAGGRFFQQPLAERVRRGFETWRDTPAWNEFGAASDPRYRVPASGIQARHIVLRAMVRLEKSRSLERALHPGKAGQPAEAWTALDALADGVARADTARAQARMTGRSSVVSMLAGPLHWLGLVDLGYALEDGGARAPIPDAYRLTDAGLWLLDLGPEPAFVEQGGRLIVQPNFSILAMEPTSDSDLMDLDQFADLQGGDRALTYHLTRQTVYRGQRSGWDVARIAAFLEERQGGPLPANVRRSLDEWQALHYRIVVYRNACVAQFADDGARDGAREALAPLRLRWAPLGSRADIIERGRAASPGGDPGSSGGSLAERVTATLVEAGWMPLVSPAGADDTAACLRIAPHGDGSDAFDVLFRQAVPSLFALSQLAPFTARDPGAPHRLQLTPASLRAALSAGASLPQVLSTLAHLHDGPLPPALENAARAWARFYGQAAVRAVSLFEFTSAEVLNNLLDDDAISGYLSPIDGSAKPLAAVAAEDSDLVRALLTERGIQVAA